MIHKLLPMASGLTFPALRAAAEARACKSVGLKFFNDPPKAPNGVLLAATTKIPSFNA